MMKEGRSRAWTRACRRSQLFVATWNVQSLVERYGGDRRVCRSRPDKSGKAGVDRKLDLLVKELKRYRVSVAAVQETRWFGNDVWESQGCTMLHSGRPLPTYNGDGKNQRNEGVGIILDGRATEAWKAGGEVWSAKSSRIVSARLKVMQRRWRNVGGSRGTKDVYMTVVSVYAPTVKAPPSVKQSFISDLQEVVDDVPSTDVLMLLGDFNARVGSGEPEDLWWDVRGKFGLRECNDAGRELLQFCMINHCTILNTVFQKQKRFLGTWTHPASKIAHMIDYVIMRSNHRGLCTDVQVMRGAECWSDHQMVRAKLRFAFQPVRSGHGSGKCGMRRFSVSKLKVESCSEEYQMKLAESLGDSPYDPEQSCEIQLVMYPRMCIRISRAGIGSGT